jgi:hypothetical protein
VKSVSGAATGVGAQSERFNKNTTQQQGTFAHKSPAEVKLVRKNVGYTSLRKSSG